MKLEESAVYAEASQIMSEERDEARDDYLGMVQMYDDTRKERDEARAMARSLRLWAGVVAPQGLLDEFDALPWAKDDAA